MMKLLRDTYHLLWALLGALWYRRPDRVLTVVGVTGTKGKSTTVELLAAIFEEAGEKTAFLSSVRMKTGDVPEMNRTGNSMPGRGKIPSFLRRAARKGCRYAFIEVTSQGIAQHRHRFIAWDAAVFTNLAPEHLEAHGSYEAYREAKLALFRALARSRKRERIAVVNGDDPESSRFAAAARADGVREISVSARAAGSALGLSGAWVSAPINRENAALAAAYAEARGIGRDAILRALNAFPGVPGRLEYIQREPFSVVVDYAHTPDSLRRVYEYLRNQTPKANSSKLVCVLGAAGGGRDRWKRPQMGAVAAEFCDAIVLTNEDPYDEDPSQILSEIESGITNYQLPIFKILDRRETLKKALSLARKGDIVIATGKGSETSIHLARGRTVPWDERGVLEEILGRRTS